MDGADDADAAPGGRLAGAPRDRRRPRRARCGSSRTAARSPHVLGRSADAWKNPPVDAREPAPVTPSRPSASADASRAAELERVRAMTVLERMALALALGRRCRTVAALVRRPATGKS